MNQGGALPRVAAAAPSRQAAPGPILWGAAGIMLGLGLLLLLALGYLRAQAIESGDRLTRSIAAVIAEQSSLTLQSVDGRLLALAQRLAAPNAAALDAASARALLNEQIRTLPFVHELIVADAQGMARFSAAGIQTGASLAARPFVQAVLGRPPGESFVVTPERSAVTGRWTLWLSRPLTASDGKLTGLVSAGVEPRYLDLVWKELGLAAGSTVSLLSRNGALLMRSPMDDALMGRSASNFPLFDGSLVLGADGRFEATSPVDGEFRRYAYRVLGAQSELIAVVGQSQSLLLAPWRQLAWVGLAVWLLASVAIGTLAAMLQRSWQQRVGAEASARETAHKLELATDAAMIAVWDWEPSNDRWTATDTYFRMLGYDPAEGFVNHRGWLERIHPDDRDQVAARINSAIAGEEAHYAYDARIRHADGSYRWIGVAARVVLRDAQGRPGRLLGVTMDITERKLAEQRLRQSEESLSITLQSIGDAVIATDVSGTVTRMNPTAERLTGWPLTDAAGRPLAQVFRIVNARTRQPAQDPVALVLERGQVVGLANHTVLLARGGQEYQIADSAAPIRDAAGQMVGVVLVFSDVSHSYRAREELAAYTDLLERAGEMAMIGGWSLERSTMRLTRPSRARRVMAHDETESPTIEQAIADYPPEARAALRALVDAGFNEGKPFDLEVPITTARVVRLRGAAQDITQRRQAEDARAALEAQLRESQKMEAMGTLAGGIAHDFNNIIATILGNTELARLDLEAGDSRQAQVGLAEIGRAGVRARNLVQQILTFSRRQPSERRPIALANVVDESVRLLRRTLPARVSLAVHCAPNLPTALADATQVEQVLINLASNALQAMAGGPGRIEIRLDAVAPDDETVMQLPELAELRARHAGALLRLVVADNGAGMDEATRARIFEPFFTTKPVGEGTGLGLSVVRGIVAAHEGAIAVASQPGQGSTFTIYLPATAATALPQPGGPAGASGPAPLRDAGHRILYLDDDEALVFLVRRMLQQQGFAVLAFTSQREALDALRADPAAFDMVVSDYNMPELSGLDVAREVRAIRPDLPVVLVSGFIDENLRAQASGAGVRELVFKASLVDELCLAIGRLLRTG
jgi:PAS domain S-box-containing protein